MGRHRPFIKEIGETEVKAALGFDPFATQEENAATTEEAAKQKVEDPNWRRERSAFSPGLLALSLPEAVDPPRALDVAEPEAFRSYFGGVVSRAHLESVGAEAAVDLLVELFGKNAVKKALLKPGRQEVLKYSTKHEIVWLAVETRRSAHKQTVREACGHLARHECIRDSSGKPAFRSTAVIEKAFYDANKALIEEPRLRELLEIVVQIRLLSWRKSGKSYSAFERDNLRGPGLAVREKTRKVSPSFGKPQ